MAEARYVKMHSGTKKRQDTFSHRKSPRSHFTIATAARAVIGSQRQLAPSQKLNVISLLRLAVWETLSVECRLSWSGETMQDRRH